MITEVSGKFKKPVDYFSGT